MKILKYQSQLNKAFFIAFSIGGLMIFASGGKKTGWIGPVLVMVIYIVYGISASKKIRITNEFADSVYYLGFVFTLISLLASVWIEIEVDSPDKILELFAVAIITTIVGIIARLGLSQFDKSTDEQIEDSNQRISNMVEDYVERLNMFSMQADEKSKQILNSYDKLINTYASQAQKITSQFQQVLNDRTIEIISEIKRNSDTYREKINEHTKNVTDDILSIHLNTEEISNKYNGEIKNMLITLNDSIHKSRDNMRQMVDISNEINDAIRESMGVAQIDISKGMDGIKESFIEVTSGLKQATDGISSDIQENMWSIHHNLENILSEQEKKTIKYVDRIQETLSGSINHLQQSYGTIFSDLEKVSKNTVSNINSNLTIIESGFNGGLGRLGEIFSGLEGISFDPTSFQNSLEEITNLNNTLRRTSATLNETYIEYNSRLSRLKDTNTEFDEQIKVLRTLLYQMNEILAEQIKKR